MPVAIEDLVTETLEESQGRGDRFVPLRVDLVVCEVVRNASRPAWGDPVELLLTVGGRWDRKRAEYVAPADHIEESLVLRCHEGQAPLAKWFAGWLCSFCRGEPTLSKRGEPVYQVMVSSGRRAGKTDFWVGKAPVAFAVAVPGSIVWIVVPDMGETDEVMRAIEEHLPAAWYRRVKEPDFVYHLVNGSKIFIRSAHDPEDLKQGRADLVVINEAQKQSEQAWAFALGGIADRGGLLVMTCNPPRDSKGSWLYDWREKAEAGEIVAEVFYLDNTRNPFVSQTALAQLYKTLAAVDKRTADIEGKGLWLPPPDVVWHAFSLTHNLVPLPDLGDATAETLRRRAGFPAANLVGIDFQKTPHMAAAAWRIFTDPTPEDGWQHDHQLVYLVRVWRVENADEDQLIDMLAADGFTGQNSIAIGDASGQYQTGAHDVKGRGSFDVFRRRGWRILPPDPRTKRNPPVEERFLVGNSLWCSSTGKRRAFVVRCPETEAALETLRKHEMRHGRPSKHSTFAHLSDAASYPLFWLFPRRAPSSGQVEMIRVERGRKNDAVGPGVPWGLRGLATEFFSPEEDDDE